MYKYKIINCKFFLKIVIPLSYLIINIFNLFKNFSIGWSKGKSIKLNLILNTFVMLLKIC